MPGMFQLEDSPVRDKGGRGDGSAGKLHQTLVFTLQVSLRVCCISWEMREVHTFEQPMEAEPNTWHKDIGGGRREVLKFVSDHEALLEWWGADGQIEWTRQWSLLGGGSLQL